MSCFYECFRSSLPAVALAIGRFTFGPATLRNSHLKGSSRERERNDVDKVEARLQNTKNEQEHSVVSREFSVDVTQIFGSQVTKLSNIQRWFCPREILSGVKKIPLFWWKMCIRWRLRFLLHQIVSWW